ncbi:alpha-N-arabinofuranosidase [Paenibacillus wynnii]|uniref:Alpha-N-arabinofuranosidase n=2 Tax=Paenibacillus wynnii TaxID=268407 RepID=A0A098M2D4_9BACL|nr:alpha-N-arabinofuranosidase [Paenibacillus wynnii]
MKKFRLSLVIVLIIVIAGGGIYLLEHPMESKTDVPYNGHGGTFKNTLAEIDTPDPSVVYRNGYYYMTFTHGGTDIMVMKSRTLDFRQAERKVVWYPPADTPYSAEIWAPEIQYLQGKWYIYFAADNGDNENHRMFALEGDSDDPLGTYTFKGQIKDDSNKWAIDGLVIEVKEKLYFVWSGWEGDVNAAQNTYIAPMSDPLTISGPRVLLSEPLLNWEKAGGPPYINEGQSILHKDDRVFIVYSGAGSWTPYYSLGMLALKPDANPLDPEGWVKSEQPLLSMDEEAEVYGPGHNSFVTSPDGSEQWIVYHATSGAADGWNNRKARAQAISWNEEGLPVFGNPLALSVPIEVPSGTGVFRAESAVRAGDSITFPSLPSTVETTVPVLIHYSNASGNTLSANIIVNDGPKLTMTLPPTDAGKVVYTYVSVPFTAGMNEVTFDLSGQKAEIIAIEIPRFEAEAAAMEGNSELEENPFASGGAIATLHDSESSLQFTNVHVPHSGVYTVTLAVMNSTQVDAKLAISVNGGKQAVYPIEQQERNQISEVSMELKLLAGANEISIFDRQGSFSIDYMDVWQDRK